jgi:hypothetical protein
LTPATRAAILLRHANAELHRFFRHSLVAMATAKRDGCLAQLVEHRLKDKRKNKQKNKRGRVNQARLQARRWAFLLAPLFTGIQEMPINASATESGTDKWKRLLT